MSAVGFILSHPEPRRITGMSISGFPSQGRYIYPGLDAVNYSFDGTTEADSMHGAEYGQGILFDRTFSALGIDLSAVGSDLSGGFLVRSDKDVWAREFRCRIWLNDHSLLPFLLSPEVESDYVLQGKTNAIESFSGTELKVSTWYPVEIAMNCELCYATQQSDEALGVMKLIEAPSSEGAIGILRFVFEKKECDNSSESFRLRRFGRPIGEGMVDCRRRSA